MCVCVCATKREYEEICMNEIELNGRAQLLYVYYSRLQLLCPFVYVCHDYYYIVIVYKKKTQQYASKRHTM